MLLALLLAYAAAPDAIATFTYKGTGHEKSVALIGELRTTSFYSVDWDPRGEPMKPLADDPTTYVAKIALEPDARVEYLFVVDGERKLDPANPNHVFNGPANAEASELTMPAHPRFDEGDTLPAEHGTVQPITDAAQFRTKIHIYLPPNYNPDDPAHRRYATIYTADGTAWEKYMALSATLDRLIAAKSIEPVIAVLIDPTEDRRSWYLFNRDYLRYLEQIVTYVDAHYATRAAAASRLHLGTSAGGRAALFAALERPDLFSNAALLSPSLNGSLAYFEPYFTNKKRPPPKLRLFISAGSFEGALEEDARLIERLFRARGLKVESLYTHEGHSFAAWRHRAAPMLAFFFRPR